MNKLNNDINHLIQILLRNNVPAIYPSKIAQLLYCEVALVEEILFRMVEEEKLEQAYELYCGDCDEVMGVFDHPDLMTSASFPCPASCAQMDSVSMNEMVTTFYPQGHRRVVYG
ncbi:MAG: hypothetical protein AB7E31_10400 [Desulfitobacterium sp.]